MTEPTLTIRAHRWPNAAGAYWLSEHRTGSAHGYFPIKEFGKTRAGGVACVLAGRACAKERGVEFVSEVGINTEDDR